ncbi:hypothetical protein N2152v2_006512 [Parachlorella kessleri]
MAPTVVPDGVSSPRAQPSIQTGWTPSVTALVVGGCTYVGHFLVKDLVARGWQVAYTYQPGEKPLYLDEARAFEVDLKTGAGLSECFYALGALSRVIYCASAAEDSGEDACAAINVPTRVLDQLDNHVKVHGFQPFFIYLSSDQVYTGNSNMGHYKEWEDVAPTTAVARSKLAGEQAVKARWPRHAILRTGAVFGPPVVRKAGELPTVAEVLADEASPAGQLRSPTFVKDLVRVCSEVLLRQDSLENRTFNVGAGAGQRMGAAALAQALAEEVKRQGGEPGGQPAAPPVEADAAGAQKRDLSMDCSRVERDLLLRLTPFKQALRETFS